MKIMNCKFYHTCNTALLIILILLYQEFKDIKVAGIVFLNLPLALIGGVLSIWFTSGIISIPSIIGFITLFGIATRNGILLVSRYQALQSQGVALYETIINGSLDRLNPILMTALTTALALIPLAIAGDLPGNEIQSPMAKVILGGLLSSTLLNIFIVPVVFYISNVKEIMINKNSRINKRWYLHHAYVHTHDDIDTSALPFKEGFGQSKSSFDYLLHPSFKLLLPCFLGA